MGIFGNLFGKGKTKEKPLDKSIKDYKKEREGYVSVGKSIYPLIKNENDPKFKMFIKNNPIITENLAEGLVTCYALDLGDKIEILSKNHLDNFGLTLKDIKDVAIRNLAIKVNASCKIAHTNFSEEFEGMPPFYRVFLDNNYDPSLLLIDQLWEGSVKEILKTDKIAISIPAKNILYFSDINDFVSFRTMKVIGEKMYEASKEDGIEITKNIYIRKDGKWILFQDTEEQMKDLN